MKIFSSAKFIGGLHMNMIADNKYNIALNGLYNR